MKKLLISAFFALTLIFTVPAHANSDKLYLYTWDTYIAPDLFKKFQDETGIEVVADIYSSNDTLVAKLQSGAAYDIVVPSGNYVPMMVEAKLLQPLPDTLRSLTAGMNDSVREPDYDPAYTYTLPFLYGTTGLAINTQLVTENITSWHQFFVRPAGEKPSLGVVDDIATVMDIASLTLNRALCDGSPETLREIQSLLKNQKPFVKVYGSAGYSERLAAGEISMQMAWNGDVYKVRQQNPHIKFIYPKEGIELWVDNLAIPARAQNTAAAEKFIAFIMRPENAAAYAAMAGMDSSVKDAFALLPAAMREAPEFNIPLGTIAGVSRACPPDVVKSYAKIWAGLTR